MDLFSIQPNTSKWGKHNSANTGTWTNIRNEEYGNTEHVNTRTDTGTQLTEHGKKHNYTVSLLVLTSFCVHFGFFLRFFNRLLTFLAIYCICVVKMDGPPSAFEEGRFLTGIKRIKKIKLRIICNIKVGYKNEIKTSGKKKKREGRGWTRSVPRLKANWRLGRLLAWSWLLTEPNLKQFGFMELHRLSSVVTTQARFVS